MGHRPWLPTSQNRDVGHPPSLKIPLQVLCHRLTGGGNMLKSILASIERRAISMRINAASRIWRGPLASNELPQEMKQVIEKFLIPSGISPDLFSQNFMWLEHHGEPKLTTQQDLTPTLSAKVFRRPMDRPFGYPLWFLAAFPDVAEWASTLSEEACLGQSRSQVDLRANLYERYMTLYPGVQIEGADGRLSSAFLKNLTEFYSQVMGRKFECSL
jgi:hypothetical protein